MGSEFLNPASQISYTEIFYEHFPFYLAIGMTADEYWNGDCTLTRYYKKAFEIKKEQKNEELWLQGAYIYDALCAVSPVLHAFAPRGTKPHPYLDKPYSLTKEKARNDEEAKHKVNRQKAKAIFEAWAATLDLPSKKGGKDNADNRRSPNRNNS